jgi:hypothetical protein
MTAVIVALTGVVLLIVLAAAVAWQEHRQLPERSIVYGVEESIDFVRSRLSDEARTVLKAADVRRMLEWSVRYLQDPSARAEGDGPPVAGGVEAAGYVQERSIEAGIAYDGSLILEVLRLQNDYLASLGAVGDVVADGPGDSD